MVCIKDWMISHIGEERKANDNNGCLVVTVWWWWWYIGLNGYEEVAFGKKKNRREKERGLGDKGEEKEKLGHGFWTFRKHDVYISLGLEFDELWSQLDFLGGFLL